MCSVNQTPLKPNLIFLFLFHALCNHAPWAHISCTQKLAGKPVLRLSWTSCSADQHRQRANTRYQLALHFCPLFSPDGSNKGNGILSADTLLPWHTWLVSESAVTLADGSSRSVSLSCLTTPGTCRLCHHRRRHLREPVPGQSLHLSK